MVFENDRRVGTIAFEKMNHTCAHLISVVVCVNIVRIYLLLETYCECYLNI